MAMAHAGTPSSISRTSTTSPAIAAAATIAGLISSVRPVGLPWRPLKLRFDDDARHLPAFELVGIHPEAHRAAGAAPLEAGLDEHLVQAARFGGAADRARSGHDQRLDVLRDVVPLDDPRRLFEIGEPAVGARADERDVDPRALHARARREPHERQRFVVRRPPSIGSETATDWPGLMPQVTVGSIAAASNVTWSS